jgi:hypothetical protein
MEPIAGASHAGLHDMRARLCGRFFLERIRPDGFVAAFAIAYNRTGAFAGGEIDAVKIRLHFH